MKKLIGLVWFLWVSFASVSQNATISGYVKDSETGETLIGANIYELKTGTGTIANEYGYYSFTLPKDSVHLRVSYIGFGAMDYHIKLDKNIKLNINLSPDNKLDEVVVSATKNQVKRTQMSVVNIPMQKVKALPVFLGEQDIIKTIQLFPGVQSGSEGSSGLYVRGGGPDQNLILLDGVPIYNASHLFGFFSIFNADAVNNATLIKGGFPARYGGRLSSVIDISMKEGNMKKFSGEGSIGLIASKLTLEGPIIKDKTSFIVSGRRTYIDILSRPFVAMANKRQNTDPNSDDKNTGGYYFWDLNAKVNHTFSPTSRLYLSGYYGLDKFYNKNKSSYTDNGTENKYESEGALKWGNAIAALRWNKVIHPKLFLNATATYSQYKFGVGFDDKYTQNAADTSYSTHYKSEYDSGIRDWTGKFDFSYNPNYNHSIRFGGGNTYHTFIPGVNQFDYSENSNTSIDTTFGSQKQYSHEHWLYVEDDWKITGRLKVNVGIHLSGFLAKETWYFSPQPRISTRFLITEKTSVKASYSRMTQYLHLLTNPTVGLPTDLWVPATDRIAPEYSDQVALGFAQSLRKGYQFSIEGYYKEMSNLIAYSEGSSFVGSSRDWQDMVTVGNGNSYGMEVLLEKKIGKTTGWIGYTLSWTNRQFDDLNFGKEYPYIYDRRHDIGIAITHKFSEKVDVGIVWVYGSGYATTLAMQTYNGIGNGYSGGINSLVPIEHIEERNDYRMPSYHRLDLGVNFHKKKKHYTRTWSLGLYNAYSRQNPFYLYYDYNDQGEKGLYQISLFPIIPSISYKMKF
jgi:outer membrane cobalamin receptor